jgi:hypothetical protein
MTPSPRTVRIVLTLTLPLQGFAAKGLKKSPLRA